jgi:hypothetical protein
VRDRTSQEGQVRGIFIVAVLGAAFTAASLPGPAQAQPVAVDLLPSYEAATIVASMGMRPLSRPRWRHGRYVVPAVDRYGREVRVVLDGYNGRVIAIGPLDRAYAREPFAGEPYAAPPPPPRRFPGPPPEERDGVRPMPPGDIPGVFTDEDDDFFDDDRQLGSVDSRIAPGNPPRQVTALPSPPRNAARPNIPRNTTASPPLPRSRPAVATIDPAIIPDQPAAEPANAPPPAAKPAPKAESKTSPKKEAAKPAEPAAPQNVRVIDLSKPKAGKPEEKPGQGIRF